MSIDMKRNLTMLTDFYEITMSNGYFQHGFQDREAVFDMFFRRIPDDGGFAIFAGLEQLIEYLQNLSFTMILTIFGRKVSSAKRFLTI